MGKVAALLAVALTVVVGMLIALCDLAASVDVALLAALALGLGVVGYWWLRGRPNDDDQSAGVLALVSISAFAAGALALLATVDDGRTLRGAVDLPIATLSFLAFGAFVLWVSSGEWGRATYHGALVLVLVLTGALVAETGRNEVLSSRGAAARSTAEVLDRDAREALEQATDEATEVRRTALATATASYRAAASALRGSLPDEPFRDELPGEGVGPAPDLGPSCPGPTPGAPDAQLCASLDVLRTWLQRWPAPEADPTVRADALEKVRGLLIVQREAATEISPLDRVRSFLVAINDAKKVPGPAETSDLPGPSEIDELVAAMCEAGGGKVGDRSPTGGVSCKEDEDASVATAAEIAKTRTELELLIAELSSDEKAVAAARKAAQGAAAGLGASPAASSVDDLLSEGADELVRTLTLGESGVPTSLGTFGWVLVGLAGLVGLRSLEARNSDRGPVTVSFGTFTGDDDKKTLEPLMKRTVLINVPEPSTVPGGSSATELTNLIDATNPASTIAKQLLAAIKAVTAISSGTQVDTTYRTSGTSDAAVHEVFVRLRAMRTGRSIATYLAVGATAELAIRNAGYWAAATILRRDRTRPSWLQWTDSSARPLAIYDTNDQDPASLTRLALLEEAAQAAPSSGVVLMRLSNAYDMHGRYADSLEMSLRAVICHPRYPEALYRLAASLSNLADQPHVTWLTVPQEQRERIVAATKRLAGGRIGELDASLFAPDQVLSAPPAKLDPMTERSRAGLWLATASIALHQAVVGSLRPMRVLPQALRRSERSFWLHQTMTREGRRDLRRMLDAVEAGKPIAQVRSQRWQDHLPAGQVRSEGVRTASRIGDVRAVNATAWWQQAYNTACYHAIRVDGVRAENLRTAMEHLERSRELPGAGDLTKRWAEIDPDLRALRHEPRFEAFLSTLRTRTDHGS